MVQGYIKKSKKMSNYFLFTARRKEGFIIRKLQFYYKFNETIFSKVNRFLSLFEKKSKIQGWQKVDFSAKVRRQRKSPVLTG